MTAATQIVLIGLVLVALFYLRLARPASLTVERVEHLARGWWRANTPRELPFELTDVVVYPAGDYWQADVWALEIANSTSLKVWPDGTIEEDLG